MRNQLPKGELTNARTGYDCTNKPDGNYPDPVDQCSGSFYMCTNGLDKFFVIYSPFNTFQTDFIAYLFLSKIFQFNDRIVLC